MLSQYVIKGVKINIYFGSNIKQGYVHITNTERVVHEEQISQSLTEAYNKENRILLVPRRCEFTMFCLAQLCARRFERLR